MGGSEWLNGTMRLNGAFWRAIDNISERSYSCAIAGWCVYESTGFHLGNIGYYHLNLNELFRALPSGLETLAALDEVNLSAVGII